MAPMSFAQQRLWFLDKLEPGTNQYTMCHATRLLGELDVLGLERALKSLRARHESLRTIFTEREGEPVQVVLLDAPWELLVTDLRSLSESERRIRCVERVEAAYGESFDLSRGPLFRAELIREGEAEQVLVLAMHHIVSDGWSIGVLRRELSALYNAYLAGEGDPLEELGIQYADFAVWQRDWLRGEELESQLVYWKEHLLGVPRLELPLDRPWPVRPSFAAGHHRFELDESLTAGLRELSRTGGVTLFTTLLSAFFVLLHRYSGQEDFAVGIPIAGRNRQDIEGLIGFFVNTLAIRNQIHHQGTFPELLRQTANAMIGALDHMDLPFEKLVEELNPERALNRTPLFDVMFNMDTEREDELRLNGLSISELSTPVTTAKFPLELYSFERAGTVKLTLVRQSEVIDGESGEILLKQYIHVLRQLVDKPESTIGAFSLVDPDSHRRLPDPRVKIDAPRQVPVVETIGKWFASARTREAICQSDRTWTYGELDRASARIAEVLHRTTQAQSVIAIVGRASFGLIAAMVGVLRGRRIMLALDPQLPAKRLQNMIHEARTSLILCLDDVGGPEYLKHDDSEVPCVRIASDTARMLESAQPVSARPGLSEFAADDPVYVFFTSGSSGIPKAVVGREQSLSHFLSWQRTTFAIGPDDRVAQLTTPSFDVILRDVFLPLSSGGTCCLPAEEDRVDVPRWLASQGVTVLHTVPALMDTWLRDGSDADLTTLRWVFSAGEPLTDVLVNRWRKAFPGAGRMVNLYGPTETTLVRTYYRLPEALRTGIQPVGTSLPHTQALVVNEAGGLCGIGERGEIVLRTPFSTLGYLNARDEQRLRFRLNPFTSDPDTVYFTGDAGRYRPDGLLEFLGRLDNQIKIRGIRIEPDEVNAIVREHPAVRTSVTVARRQDDQDTQLVTYIVPLERGRLDYREINAFLKERLPAIMVPRSLVVLDRFPLLPSGKVDRNGLPDPEQPPIIRDAVEPRTYHEEVVCRIWAEILECGQIGIHDDFFVLGGHSLKALQVLSRIRSTLQVQVPLRVLFERTTVADLAEYLQNQSVETKEGDRVTALARGERKAGG